MSRDGWTGDSCEAFCWCQLCTAPSRGCFVARSSHFTLTQLCRTPDDARAGAMDQRVTCSLARRVGQHCTPPTTTTIL